MGEVSFVKVFIVKVDSVGFYRCFVCLCYYGNYFWVVYVVI